MKTDKEKCVSEHRKEKVVETPLRARLATMAIVHRRDSRCSDYDIYFKISLFFQNTRTFLGTSATVEQSGGVPESGSCKVTRFRCLRSFIF